MRTQDIETIVDMCMAEYGSPKRPATIHKFPWNKSPDALADWWERFSLRPLIHFSLQLKLHSNLQHQDHTLLVATNNHQIVGLIEISRQPPLADRNPPILPLPLVLKQLYCSIARLPPPQGWISNLLVDPAFRGLGYAKLLVLVAEGIARSWKCNSIHLHAHADGTGGRIAQGLYSSLGYETRGSSSDNDAFSWMGPEVLLSSSIYVIDGVPLLYLRKVL